MNIAAVTSLEGFICPACLVDFPGAVKLQDHWLNFHSPNTVRGSKTSNDYEEIPDDTPSNSTSKVCVFHYLIFFDCLSFEMSLYMAILRCCLYSLRSGFCFQKLASCPRRSFISEKHSTITQFKRCFALYREYQDVLLQ